MNNLFLDYENFWDVKYSLTTQGMSYTDFILDERFQIHGASVAIDKEDPYFLKEPDLRRFFEDIDGHEMRLVCHNMLYDGFITTHNYIPFKEYFCTLAMLDAIYQGGIGVGLDEAMKTLLGMEGKSDIIKRLKGVRTEDITPEQWDELIVYANYDLEATQKLYYMFAKCLPAQEHQIMDIILKMFVHAKLQFDEKTLTEAVKEADDDRNSRIANALAYGTTEEELKGNKTFPALLERMGYEVPMKPSPSVEDAMIPALAKTDAKFQEMLESSDEKLRALVEGRLAVKSTQATTRAYRFLKLHEELGKLPVAYNYARAHTWRLSGANKINCANLKRGSKLRTCIIAPKGYRLAVVDASQIECRTDGHIAGQDSLMELFRAKKDPYNDLASVIFGRPIDRKFEDADGNCPDFFEGFIGKTATLGLGYYMGGKKFKWTVDSKAKTDLGLDIDFPIDEAYRIVSLYRQKNWKITAFWDHCDNMLHAMLNDENMTWQSYETILEVRGKENKIYFPNGTWLYYPGLDWSDGQFTYLKRRKGRYITKYLYGGLVCENIVQKMSRDITSGHMVEIAERYPVVMHTYDENIALVPEKEADEAVEWMIDIMEKPPVWAASLPLAAEGGHAREYSK